jgi:nitrite reductase (NADH) small subunit
LETYNLGPVTQIPPGEGRSFLVGDIGVAVFRTRDGKFYATQARCPHRGGPLADGLTDGTTVVCPLHDRMFSLASGEGIGNECSIAIYPVAVSNDLIFLEHSGVAAAGTAQAGGA